MQTTVLFFCFIYLFMDCLTFKIFALCFVSFIGELSNILEGFNTYTISSLLYKLLYHLQPVTQAFDATSNHQ